MAEQTMASDTAVKEHIQKTIETMQTLGSSQDLNIRKQFSRIIGDQYEALIALSASELRDMAGNSEPEQD